MEAARERAERAAALIDELRRSRFDGTDAERVAWLRLDFTGQLVSLAFSPTIDRLSNPVVAEAVLEAWTAAGSARDEAARRLEERAGARPRLSGGREGVAARMRALLEARSRERFEHLDEDELCSAQVDI